MPTQAKLERLDIPAVCRVVKDWFPTRESAEAVLAAILAHIKTTGETHTCVFHTHTKPSRDAVPVYLAEFDLPERQRKAKRFAPCPCCWDEFGKFGFGRVAWFPDERVIRIIGPDCFASLSPEGHRQARDRYELEREQKRNADFLLANVGRLPEVISVIQSAIFVSTALELFHTLLHDRCKSVGLNLWPYVRRNGELPITVREQEFRRGNDGEMYAHDVDVSRTFATLPQYILLDAGSLNLTAALERAVVRIRPYVFGDGWRAAVERMTDTERATAAETLSRAIQAAKKTIAEIKFLRAFAERAMVNTLRNWAAHEGCPVSFTMSHKDTYIEVSRSGRTGRVPLPNGLQNHIGDIEFWIALEPRRRR